MSLALDSNAEAAWPLFIESHGVASSVLLAPGDAVFYRGTRNPHWREAQPGDRWSTIGFYHFVPDDFVGSLD